MASVDPFVVQWPSQWVNDPEIGPVIHYLNRYLHDLFIFTTDGTGSSVIADAVVAEKYPWPITNIAQQDSFDYPSKVIPAKQYNAVTTSVNYTANPYDFINAKKGATITFPEYPIENGVIIVRNGDGSNIRLSGNGKTMNGESTGTIQVKGTAIVFHYFIDSDEWLVR